ncbi:polysaccharide biosynthesis/export family protein [Adhaeretor mobilis]|uniref:Polysaccharide biosynthesis/export protein n=1 Tax=Adhaeretor mobilis TaxID=1930276 RepID=A0A517MPY8_9BACT|nr:polysaccharide biosynthesis/export family protein [Adhaeretor mobilis]QDS96939.1 Polysaccharide biosynthesis/export protein [Adhaeretor mobilis]
MSNLSSLLPHSLVAWSRATRQLHGNMVLSLVVCLLSSGCAALTNPVANGIPARILPEELLAESKEGFEPIPLTLLRQAPPKEYFLESGDTLGIYIEGILGNEETPPPVNIPDSTEEPPSIGYPFPIRDDGTISLPYVGKVKVAKPALEESITIEQAEEKVVDAYREKDILRVEDKRILVSLFRPRYVQVLVIRSDSSQPSVSLQSSSPLALGGTSASIGGGRTAVGKILELPAGQNDVLNALARIGGIPGIDSTQEIIIQRGYWDAYLDPTASDCQYPTEADLTGRNPTGDGAERRITRIPLRTRCGESLSFGPEDVVLNSGDIVIVRGRDPEYYYTGGLIPSAENVLPFHHDITVVEAVLRARGPLINGGVNSSNLSGAIVGSGVGNPSPSLVSVVRKLPTGRQVNIRVDLNEAMRDPRQNLLVQAEDVLILQEAPNEAITRYMTQVLQFNFFGRFINRADAQGSMTAVAP